MILVDIPAPFPENPYDNYHPVNLDSLKCCLTAAFCYYIGRHIKKAVMDEVDVKIVATRVQKILAMMVLSRNLFSNNVAETSENMNLVFGSCFRDIGIEEPTIPQFICPAKLSSSCEKTLALLMV